jgi:hypothetical protein
MCPSGSKRVKTIIQQQQVDGDVDDAVDPESDISRDDSGMETDEDDNVDIFVTPAESIWTHVSLRQQGG